MNQQDKRFWTQLACLWIFLWVLVAAPYVISALASTTGQGYATKHLTITVAAGASSNTWTYVQDSNVLFCSQAGSSAACTIGVAQIAPTLPGSVWIIQIKTLNNVTIQSITGGGGTWVHCSNCHVTNPVNGGNLDASYNLTGTAGTSQNITVTLTGVSGGSGMGMNFIEFLPPAGSTASLDASGTAAPAACTTCTGVGLSITATDFIWESPGNSTQVLWNSVSSPWVLDGNGGQYNLNANSGTAPTILIETIPASGGSPISPTYVALAFKSTAGTFSPPAYLSQNTIVQFDFFTATCTPTCTRTLPQATAAGNLLVVMGANLNFVDISSVSGGGSPWIVPSGANTCRIHYVQAGNNALSCAYLLSSTAGATSINITLSGNVSTGFGIWEISSNTGIPWQLDVQNSQVNANGANPPGAPVTINGRNDAIFQGFFGPGGLSDATFFPQTYTAHAGIGYILFNEASEALLLNSGPTAPTSIWIDPQVTQNTAGFTIAFTAAGRIFTAADCTFATVSALVSSSANGDTIVLPACSQTNWGNNATSGNGSLNVNKCIRITGQGAGSTAVGDNVLKDGASNSSVFVFSGACGAIRAGLDSINLVGVAPDASVFAHGHISLTGSSTAFRVHHVTMTTPRTEFVVADFVGTALFDHNTISGCSSGAGGVDFRASQWGGGSFGDGAWADNTIQPGSGKGYFYEDNTVNCGVIAQDAQLVDGNQGAQWTARFNTIISGAFTSHGTDQDRRRGFRMFEYYDNTLDFTQIIGGAASYMAWIRGATGMNFDNTWTGPVGSGLRTFYCRIASNPCGSSPFPPWGACDGTGTWDQNTPGQNGYRCVDQVGSGTSNSISGSPPSPAAWVGNALQPVYSFHNTVDNGQGGANVQTNRDIYFLDAAHCNVSGCTAGVGRGTGASKPTTCTPNTAWWATDEGFWNNNTPGVAGGRLYVCGSSNNWVLTYTPSTYPHPMQAL